MEIIVKQFLFYLFPLDNTYLAANALIPLMYGRIHSESGKLAKHDIRNIMIQLIIIYISITFPQIVVPFCC